MTQFFRKITTILLIIAANATLLSAQKNNTITNNVASLGVFNASFIYQRAILPKFSLNIGVSFMATPKIFNRPTLATLEIGRFSGIAITPELRYYITKKGNHTGLYTGIYGRYSGYKVPMNFSSNVVLPVQIDGKMYMRSYSAGVQLGYQWLIKDKFVIDWFFFGPKVTRQTVGAKFNVAVDKQYLIDQLETYKTYDVLKLGVVDRAINRVQKFDADRILDARKGYFIGSIRTGVGIGIRF